jgi:arabinofuranosyltransferase
MSFKFSFFKWAGRLLHPEIHRRVARDAAAIMRADFCPLFRLNRTKFLMINAAVLLTAILVLKNSWVTEDAFITFRYAVNFVAGHGLVFNIGERVQGFSHPLWLFGMIIAEILHMNLYYGAMLFGLICNGLMVYLFIELLYRQKYGYRSILFGLIVLYSCSVFLDFQTSGLESSLTHLLIMSIVYYFLTWRVASPLWLYLLISLLLLNRFDHIFLSAPIIAYLFIKKDTDHLLKKIMRLLIGFLPIILWEIFSVVYYGFIFPNTKYAKVVIPMHYAVSRGLIYLADFIVWEPLPAIVFLMALIWLGVRIKKIRPDLGVLVLAAVIHLGYLLIIGGDFMRGRFILSSFFLTIVTASYLMAQFEIRRSWAITALAALFIMGGVSQHRAESIGNVFQDFSRNIVNERIFYKYTNMLRSPSHHGAPSHFWADEGKYVRTQIGARPITVLRKNIGMFGYYAGSQVTIVDLDGLTDAFIARTPVGSDYQSMKVGHGLRAIPTEYLDGRVRGVFRPVWQDQAWQHLWQDMTVVTSGKIFSLQRFRTMLKIWLQFGF